jgi:hypothetical protein
MTRSFTQKKGIHHIIRKYFEMLLGKLIIICKKKQLAKANCSDMMGINGRTEKYD